MSIIDDKEVGKFWKLVHETKDYPILYEIAVPLIRKLVAEREKQESLWSVLADFGIERADWEHSD